MLKFLKSMLNGIRRKPETVKKPIGFSMTHTTNTRKESSKTESQPQRANLAAGCDSKRNGSKIDYEQFTRQLKLHEGVMLKAYKCTADKTTIGVGRNLDDVGITEEEAEYLLQNDIDRVILALRRELPWIDQLDEVRQRVLYDMAFNLGISGLLQFKKTLKAVKDGDYERAGRMMLDSKWATQVGKRSDRLSVMMNIGKDPRELWPPQKR